MKKQLDIAIVRTHYEFSGIKRYLELMCDALAKHHPEIRLHMLLHPEYHRAWPKEFWHSQSVFPWKIRVAAFLDSHLPTSRNLMGIRGSERFTKKINKLLKRLLGIPQDNWQYFIEDYLHKHQAFYDSIYYCQPNQKDNLPHNTNSLVTLWVDFSEDQNDGYLEELKKSYDRWFAASDHVVFLTETIRNRAHQLDPTLKPEKTSTISIPPGLVSPSDQDVKKIKRLIPNGNVKKLALMPGRAHERKRHATLIKAIKILEQEGSCPIAPVFCGPDTDGFSDPHKAVNKEYAMEISQLCDQSGLVWGDQLHALGLLSESELAAAFRLSSLCIFPSAYEGLGLPILEAMKAGIPVICSDIDVFKQELRARDLEAHFFTVDDPQSLAKAILHISENWEQAIRTADKNQKIVGTITWEGFANQYHKVFSQSIDSQ